MNAEQPKSTAKKRRGVVLVAVLVVVVLLSLAGYQYSEMTLAEYKAAENTHRAVQARAFADSGIHYAAALVSNPDNFAGILGGNQWNNPAAFQGVAIQGDNGINGYFSIIAPPDPTSTTATDCTYGVMDEGAKINLNAMMKIDSTGQQLHDMLIKLPNMTDDIAYSIVAWMGGSAGAQNGGAGSDYYSSLNPPYRAKLGPIDSIDELLLIRGVTRDLLYGTDWNRNGVQDANETTSNTFDRGWSAFLTVHSREQNSDASGNAFIFLNNTDLTALSTAFEATDIDANLAKFIIMYRQNASADVTGSGAGGGNKAGDVASYQLDLTKKASYTINSIFDLVGVKLTIKTTDPATNKMVTLDYQSPLNDTSMARDLLPKLFAVATLTDPTQSSEIPARININTAALEVLSALPSLTETDVQNIVAMKPQLSTAQGASDIFQTPTWLMTEAQISVATLRQLDKYLTTRTQVFRVQSVGYFDGKGPSIRVEAVVDTNSGRPRILAWRNLSDLGKGWNDANMNANP